MDKYIRIYVYIQKKEVLIQIDFLKLFGKLLYLQMYSLMRVISSVYIQINIIRFNIYSFKKIGLIVFYLL